MRKTKMQKRPKSTDTLLKTSKKKDIELTEKELDEVSGGKGSAQTQKYMEIKNQDIIISS
jgi:bacteriocin-like protein